MTALEPHCLTIPIAITLRPATPDDLPKLEWYGQYAHFRNLFHRAFQEQQRGKRCMLIADSNNFPIGHIFIQFLAPEPFRDDMEGRGYLYAFRVMEMFRGYGIGTQLLLTAEALIRDRGLPWATIAVSKDNPRAQQLYERLGYQVVGQDEGRWQYVDHQGQIRYIHEPCWLLRKRVCLR